MFVHLGESVFAEATRKYSKASYHDGDTSDQVDIQSSFQSILSADPTYHLNQLQLQGLGVES